MASDYKRSAITGGSWAFGTQAFLVLIQLASIATLARLLKPTDFGLIGMLAAVTAFIGLFREGELTTAIVQKPSVSNGELSRLFYLTVFLGVASCLLTIIAGYLTSILLHEPRLAQIAPWFGLCFIFGALESVPLGILRRNLQFRGIAIRDISVRTLSFVAALLSGLAGHGYWALVVQSVTASAFSLLVTMMAANYLPTSKPSPWHTIKSYVSFGAAFTGSSVASYLTQNLDSLLIGKLSGIEALGVYSRSRALMVAPINQVLSPVGSVLIPIFSRISGDGDQTRRWLDRITTIFLIIAAPGAAFCIAAADDLVHILLGSGWDRATPIFQWLAITIFIAPFGSVLYWALVASGKTRILIHWTWLEAIVTSSSIACAAPWGAVATAASFGLCGLILRIIIGIYFTAKAGIISFRPYATKYCLGIIYAFIWLLYLVSIQHLFLGNVGSHYFKCLILAATGFTTFILLLSVTSYGRDQLKQAINMLTPIKS